MRKKTDSVIFSETQREVLETALKNPTLSNAEIADKTGTRITFVRDTREEYQEDVDLADDIKKADESADTATEIDVAGLSETQTSILETAVKNPLMSNADIAAETGTRVALVRDVRDEYEDDVDLAADNAAGDNADSADDDGEASTETGPAEPSEIQTEILTLAANSPGMSNSDIAAETGARMTLVRDTRDQYEGDVELADDSGDAEPDSVAASPEIDTDQFNQTQQAILETSFEDPTMTNAEIAAETGTRITLVRDTLAEYESDDEAPAAVAETPTEIDTEAFSEAQVEILNHVVNDPELSNAEIAAETGIRITLVRDTRDQYNGEGVYADDASAADDTESAVDDQGVAEDGTEDVDDSEPAPDDTEPADEPVELPETTASDLFSETQRAILETALENSDLTNGEIADETGARITLVRDTRATYEDAVDLAGEDDEPVADPETTADETFTETQQAILETALENSDLTNAEIADRTGARITLVRDTRETYGDTVELADATESTDATESADTAESTTDVDSVEDVTPTEDVASTEDVTSTKDVDSTRETEPGANNRSAVLVGLLILILLAIGIALSLL